MAVQQDVVDTILGLKHEPFLTYEVVMWGCKYVFNVVEEVAFEVETVDEALLRHTEKTAIVASFFEQAKVNYELLERELTHLKASKFVEAKDTQKDSTGKAISDGKTEMVVEADADVHVLSLQVIQARHVMSKLKTLVALFATRKDLLQTFCANVRHIV